MGVRGLQTFLKDNRQSLCRSVVLDSAGAGERARVPVVVDAWGVVYQLYLDALPWASGGEYWQLYELVQRLISSWRRVGLEPVFVFDGAGPPSKHATAVARMQSGIETARLFYSLSEGTRSTRAFNRGGTVLLPPFASHVFAAALSAAGVDTRFAPIGEADGLCVALADAAGGYVLGRDTDLLILCARATGVRGYVPLDMLEWVDAAPADEVPDAGFSVAGGRRRRAKPPSSRSRSRLLPPTSYRSPTLVMATYTATALGTRLRLAPALLPLLSALVGNDYSPRVDLWPSKPSERIDAIARILREQAAKPRTAAAASADPAHTLVARVLAALLPPHTSTGELARLTEAILDATMGYVLPPPPCCDAAPFCGDLDDAGCVAAHSRLSSAGRSPEPERADDEDVEPIVVEDALAPAVKAYAAARAAGRLGPITHAWLYPTRIYLHAVLENPSAPSGRAARMPTEARRQAYTIAAEALGGLRWPKRARRKAKAVTDGGAAVEQAADEAESVAGDIGSADDDREPASSLAESANKEETPTPDKPNTESGNGYDSDATSVVTSEASSIITVEDNAEDRGTPADDVADVEDAEDELAEQMEALDLTPKVVEYLQQGSSTRIGAREVELPEATEEGRAVPLCLGPEDERRGVYLAALGARTPAIEALPAFLHPLAAAVRMCIIGAAEADTRGTRRWQRGEVAAVLRAGIGCAEGWRRGVAAGVDGEAEDAAGTADESTDASQSDAGSHAGGTTDPNYPVLSSRHAEMVAGLSAALLDTLPLAQSLLLSPATAAAVDVDSPHTAPYVFFSGVALHSLLNGLDPPPVTGWVWDASLRKTLDRASAAVLDGMDEYLLYPTGSSVGPAPAQAATMSAKQRKKERQKQRKHAGAPSPAPRAGAGRFAALLEA